MIGAESYALHLSRVVQLLKESQQRLAKSSMKYEQSH